MDKDNTLERNFLNECVSKKTPCTVFLVNGVKLQGQIGNHDTDTVELIRERQKQLVYKRAISTVMPNVQPPSMLEDRGS